MVSGLYAFQAIAAALYARKSEPTGRFIDCSLMQSAAAIQAIRVMEFSVAGITVFRSDRFDSSTGVIEPVLHVRQVVQRAGVQRSFHSAAVGVAADNDVPHLQVDDGVLDGGASGTGPRGRRWDDVGDVADVEELSGIGAGDELGYDARIRAPDPHHLGVLAFFGELFEDLVVGFELLPESSMS